MLKFTLVSNNIHLLVYDVLLVLHWCYQSLERGWRVLESNPCCHPGKKLNAARLSELRACCWTTENSDFYHNHSKYERKTSKKFTKKFVSEGRANMLYREPLKKWMNSKLPVSLRSWTDGQNQRVPNPSNWCCVALPKYWSCHCR